nr:immunoglobulin heavy chain junction region [Macaca mulatta]
CTRGEGDGLDSW